MNNLFTSIQKNTLHDILLHCKYYEFCKKLYTHFQYSLSKNLFDFFIDYDVINKILGVYCIYYHTRSLCIG